MKLVAELVLVRQTGWDTMWAGEASSGEVGDTSATDTVLRLAVLDFAKLAFASLVVRLTNGYSEWLR